jgi:hypothetical protein
MSDWSDEQLQHLAQSAELQISAGPRLRWTPVWVVVVGSEVFVRTWTRRQTGWYGAAVREGRARLRLPDGDAEAVVVPEGASRAAAVDTAYQAKYGAGGAASMVTPEAAASTLRLDRLPADASSP